MHHYTGWGRFTRAMYVACCMFQFINLISFDYDQKGQNIFRNINITDEKVRL